VAAVGQYHEFAITFTSLTQSDNRIQLVGRAMSNDAVVRYQQRLLGSGAFRDLTVVSMTAISPTLQAGEGTESSDPTTPLPPEASPGHVEFVIDLLLEPSEP
jgi:hypothetical protein